jgi:eukaryotic-like serine/threonine-protein kinase
VSAAQPLSVGDTVGKYRVTEKLGEGGMGVVFAGIHEALGREVAIKLLRAQYVKNENMLARFQQEAEAVSRIGHANIVAVYDFGRTSDGSAFYVMERIRGETLTGRMKRDPPLGPEEGVAIFAQICRALGATHARGIIHRDLKPDNVLLQTQPSGPPHVKVVDFGVAKVREPVMGGGLTSGGPSLTLAGTLIGTPAFMAPEQIMAAQDVDGRADIYSLGAMLYQVLTGALPFAGEQIAVLMAHVQEPPPAPSAKAPQVTPALDAVVLKAMAKKPADRHADPAAFIAHLEEAWIGRVRGVRAPSGTTTPSGSTPAPGTSATPAPGANAAPEPARTRGSSIAAPLAGVVLALACAGGGYWWWRAHHATPTPAPAPAPSRPLAAIEQRASQVMHAALAGDAPERRAALEAIAELGARQALDDVTRALDDENPEVRRGAAQAARAIGRPEDAALLAALTAAAEKSGGSLALDIAVARAQLDAAGATEELRRGLTRPDPLARLKAALALAERDQLPAAKLRAALAQATSARRALRWDAYLCLHRLGDTEFEKELVAALDGADPVARLDSAQTFARAGDERGKRVLAELAKSGDGATKVEAESLLAEQGVPEARDNVIFLLDAPDAASQKRAALALGRLVRATRDPAALGALARALDRDGDRTLKLIAAAALYPATPSKGAP